MLFHSCVRSARPARSLSRPAPPVHGELLEPRRLMAAETSVTLETYLDGVQLRVVGTDGDDHITVRSDPDLGLVVTSAADELVHAYGGEVKTLRIAGGAGNDSIRIDPSVSLRTFLYGEEGDDVLVGGPGADYLSGGGGKNALDGQGGDDVLVTIGGGIADRLTGGAGADSFWLDAKRTETVTDLTSDETLGGAVHRVGSFFSRVRSASAKSVWGNVSLAAADLPDPAVSEPRFVYRNFADRPLFGDAGPLPDDVKQGAIGDCYSLVVLSSMAALNPAKLRESVVELGDGTYAVQFRRGSARMFVRVDADLPVRPESEMPAYAALGAQDAMWVAVIQKAHAVVRTARGSYTGLDGGWMRESYSLFGAKSQTFWTSNADALMRTIQLLLNAGRSVTYATVEPPAGAPLLSSHAYTVVGVEVDGTGRAVALRLRNPWGRDGAGSDGNDDGFVTVPAHQAVAALAGVCTAAVSAGFPKPTR